MRRYLGLALAGVLAAISFGAFAMGLGEIRLNSWLNQRLDAEIELVSAAADEIESLKITLADNAVYERYGLERTPLLNSVRFEIVRRPNGTAYIKVTSTEPIREPFLTLFVVADWSRGRLMREYTLLIDPPTFVRQEPEAQSQPQAPAVQPAPAPAQVPVEQAREPEPFAEQPAPAVEEPATRVEETRGDVISIPPLEADAAPSYAELEPETGGNYGPIQRNETLWGIARRLRPDDSVTINQMMLALYRANPEAFQGNINRLKAGYILRIPEYREIASLTRRDAFNEVKRQNEAWQADRLAPAAGTVSRGEPEVVEPAPELTLVAPEEDVAPEIGTGVGVGGEADDLGMGSEEAIDPAEDIEEGAVDLGVEDDTPDRLLDLEDESMQALQEQEDPFADDESYEDSETDAAETADDEMAFDDSVTEPLPLPGEQDAGEEALADSSADKAGADETIAGEGAGDEQPAADADDPVTAPVVPIRRAPEPGLVDQARAFLFSPLGMGVVAAIIVLLLAGVLVMRKRRAAADAGTVVVMDWDDESDEAPTVIDGDEADVTVVTSRDEGEDSDIATVFGHDMEHEDTGTTKLPEEDEASESFDADETQLVSQDADELVDTMVGGRTVTLDDNDPLSEADFHMAYGLYDQAAEVVQKAAEREPSRKDYQAKLAEIHFAAGNSEEFLDAARRLKELAGPGDADWDNVAIMGRQIAPNDPLFGEAGSTASVDLDFGAAADEVEAPAGTSTTDAGDLDFDIALDDSGSQADAEQAETGAETGTGDDDGLEFDLDMGSLESTDEATGTETAAASTESDDDFNFDLGELEGEPATTTDADAGDFTISGDDAGASPDTDEQTQTEFDKALEELSAFVDTNLPEQDAGDAVGDADAELNLDDYSFDDEDAGAQAETSEGAGDDDEDIGEAGTKLDLARAYIDMGDPEGARGILEEVIADGDDDQQREARELLDQLA